MLKLYTKEDYDKGLKPTQIREGIKIDFCKLYYSTGSTGETLEQFVIINTEGHYRVIHLNGKFLINNEPSKDLMIEVSDVYKEGDWVITKGYSDDYDGKALKIKKIIDNKYCLFEPYLSNMHIFDLPLIQRFATPEEIAEVEKLIDPYKDLKDAWKEGKTIQLLVDGKWNDLVYSENIEFIPDYYFKYQPEFYRIKHKHQDCIDAFERGEKIELKYPYGWASVTTPNWSETLEYRIKPKEGYVPFTWEDRELLKGKWIVVKNSVNKNESLVIQIFLDEHKFYINGISSEQLLIDYTFLDGAPCGKLKQ